MTSFRRADDFLHSSLRGIFALKRPHSIGQTLLLVLGFVAFAPMGCATTIATKYPHLDRRAVCVLPPEIESDSTEFVFTEDNVPVSGFHPEIVDRVAATTRTVFEYDPNADPGSVRYLPAPYNELTCPERFAPLPSRDAEIKPLPVAAVNLLLHERHPEPVSTVLADELAKCSSQISSQVTSIQHTMQVNVYVTNEGQTVFAYVANSTLQNRKLNACVVKVLRTTQWSAIAASAPNVAAAPIALKTFLAQPVPVEPVPDWAEKSGIRRIQPQPSPPPANAPTGVRIPRIFVIPIGAIAAAAAVFGIIYFWSDNDVPAWLDELNPITREQYTSPQEYEEVQRLSPEEIQQRRAAHIKATQSQPPPASAPPPAPTLTPEQQREQQKKRERCEKLAKKIDEIINAERKEPPKNGRPQGRKGITERWREIAANEGKWGFKPDGSLGRQLQGHFLAYEAAQKEIIKELDNWKVQECDDKDHGLPRNARQYAAQKPEIGPGKPLEPAPTPVYIPAVLPPVIVPQPKKASK